MEMFFLCLPGFSYCIDAPNPAGEMRTVRLPASRAVLPRLTMTMWMLASYVDTQSIIHDAARVYIDAFARMAKPQMFPGLSLPCPSQGQPPSPGPCPPETSSPAVGQVSNPA